MFFLYKKIKIFLKKLLTFKNRYAIISTFAGVAESADAHVWGACVSNVRVQVPSPAPKINAEWDTFCVYFLSKSQTWHIITARSVVDIISPLGCISSRNSVHFLRLDDIQNFVLMICNFLRNWWYTRLRLDFLRYQNRFLHTKESGSALALPLSFGADLIKQDLKGRRNEWQHGVLSERRLTEERSKAEIKASALRRSDETQSCYPHQKTKSKDLVFSFVPQGTTSFAWHTQHHLSFSSTSLPLAAQMNDLPRSA